MNNPWILTLFLIILTGCAAPARTTLASTLAPKAAPTAPAITATANGNAGCVLQPVIAPTKPAFVPTTTGVDQTTGLHMTGVVQVIDLASYRLKVSGKVDHPLSLRYDDLRCMPKITAAPTLVCPGVFTDHATWSGVPIKDVLERAGVQPGATKLALKGADGYEVSVPLEDALDPKNYLAYEWEGQPLPILHGFPLRAVFPDQPGGKWVKWLLEFVLE